jgi:hypothetical protein
MIRGGLASLFASDLSCNWNFRRIQSSFSSSPRPSRGSQKCSRRSVIPYTCHRSSLCSNGAQQHPTQHRDRQSYAPASSRIRTGRCTTNCHRGKASAAQTQNASHQRHDPTPRQAGKNHRAFPLHGWCCATNSFGHSTAPSQAYSLPCSCSTAVKRLWRTRSQTCGSNPGLPMTCHLLTILCSSDMCCFPRGQDCRSLLLSVR